MTNITQTEIVNIAGYRFVELDRLTERRESLRTLCKTLGLKGTILLSPEGLNLFLAGRRESIDSFLAELRSEPEFTDFHVKESPTSDQPFNRLLVRLKKEIIAFGVDGIAPGKKTSQRLTPAELKTWLDEGRDFTLLDTRNNYEIELGTFHGALPADIDHFRDFPAAAQRLPESARQKPLVMFCTGGIRCEKAGPYMEQAGFEHVYQLDGGILQYFEDCGGAHYDGGCFVFDQRVAVNPDLKPTGHTLCFACREALTPDDVRSEQYRPGEYCPRCYVPPAERMKQSIESRMIALKAATNPLPGSIPYTNLRPLNVPARYDGESLIHFLTQFHPHIDIAHWEKAIAEGRMTFQGQSLSADSIVRGGHRIEHRIPGTVEPPVSPEITILFEDEALVVVNKPAPLPMHASGRFNRNSLTWILNQVYESPLRAAHRLDANTTGLVILSRSLAVARRVQDQFAGRKVGKRYVARVHGHPPSDHFVLDKPITDTRREAGARSVGEKGLEARTEVRVRQRLDDGTALVDVVPESGRTNQIRLHLWDAGHAIVGDPAWLPNKQLGDRQTLRPEEPPLCLHATWLRLAHPLQQQPIEFDGIDPQWLRDVRM